MRELIHRWFVPITMWATAVFPLLLAVVCALPNFFGGWSFVWDDQALFYSDFEAWQFGPVNYEVYNYFKKYGGNEIPKTESVNKVSNFKAKETIEAIWNIYGSYNAFKLVEITHNQTPWQYAYQNDTIITSDMIKNYFKSKY